MKKKWKKRLLPHSVAIGVVIGVTAFVFYGLPLIKPYIQSKQPQPKPPPIVQIKKPNLAKLIQERQPKLDPSTAKEIATAVEKYAKKYKFTHELII